MPDRKNPPRDPNSYSFPDFVPHLVEDETNPASPLNRQLALEISEALGPDWCQTLYRFAVLCTKMQSIR